MAGTRRLTTAAALVLVLASTAGASPCEEGRPQTGLALRGGPEGLSVVVADAASAAAVGGLAIGDVMVQANGTVLETCGDWARAVREAMRGRKALLLLVRRGESEVPLALGRATWERVVVATAPPPPPVAPPSIAEVVATSPPPALAPETQVTVEEVVDGIERLAAGRGPRARLDEYRRDLGDVHGRIETLAGRAAAPASVLSGLRTVVRYYDAAAVAWAAAEDLRERQGRPRRVPLGPGATADFFLHSETQAALDEFPFLRATVVREPKASVLGSESAGRWRPLEARTLLFDHGAREVARLGGWLRVNRPSDAAGGAPSPLPADAP